MSKRPKPKDLTAEQQRVRDRQNGDYEAPVVSEPVGGPVPDSSDKSKK